MILWLEIDVGQLNIAPKLRVPYEGPYMIQKQLGALEYELHLDHRKTKAVHHNRLKLYHGLKRPPGYYHALAEAKGDSPQPQVLIPSWGHRLTSVPQVVWLHRQRDSPLLSGLLCPEVAGGEFLLLWVDTTLYPECIILL